MKVPYKSLSTEQLMRYSRHIMLNDMDIDGQEILWNSRILLIGVGGLGCAVAQYLTASGVGSLTLVDDDIVERTNLQRQVLHTEAAIGINKCVSAVQRLQQINSEVEFQIIQQRLIATELDEQVAAHDLVIDCCDNLATRNAINQACVKHQTPLVSGAAIRFEGQVAVFDMQEHSPCYGCFSLLFGEQQLTCVDAGVLSPLVGMVGSIQAIEAIKLLTHIGTTLTGKLLLIDAAQMQIKPLTLNKHSSCLICSK